MRGHPSTASSKKSTTQAFHSALGYRPPIEFERSLAGSFRCWSTTGGSMKK